jgi:glucokinase
VKVYFFERVAEEWYHPPFMGDYSIGVDLGGTNLRAAAISREGKILDKIAVDTDVAGGRPAVIGDIVNTINTLRDRRKDGRIVGVGIGVPGFILLEKGFVVGSNNLPFLEDFPLRDEIERILGTPVILENDANAAAMGEKWMGAGKDVQDLVLLTLGTGIGGGIISGGRVLHGYLGMAGELGHLTVVPNGNPCGCGNIGCLEKHASATAVESMAKLLSLGDHVTSLDVYNMAVDGNERARTVFECMGTALGTALAMLVNVFNFPLYLLSGGALPAWDFFAPAMFAEVRKRSYAFRHSNTRIERATLGNQAGLFGAAYLPFLAHGRI